MSEKTDTSIAQQQIGEDAYFVLRDCRELFQQRLVDIARTSGITSPPVIEAFSRELGNAHDELASSAPQEGFEQTAGLTASRISLVGHDDLELDIRIGEIANRLKGNDRIDHWRVQLRYMTLLQRPKMSAENNPLGLEPICRALWTLCTESGGTLEQNLDRLDRLEELLQAQLPEVYIELNSLLERHHVEPAPVQLVQRGGGGSSSSGSGDIVSGGTGSSGAQTGGNALSALQRAMQQQFGSDGSFPSDFAAGNTTAMVMLNHLMERLNTLEDQQLSGPTGNRASEQSANHAALHALRSKDIDLPMGKSATIAMDVLSLIFDSIFAEPDLPDAVKAAIGRLQIPLLRLAILDASFFSDSQHPARQLVNRMARAAIGLAQDSGRDHPVCLRLGKLADAVRSTLEQDENDLSPYLAELETLIGSRDQLIQTNAQPYLRLVIEHEAVESSRTIASIWLKKTLAKTSEPALVTFLTAHWLRVMQAACLDGGATGTRWKEAEIACDELIWSMQPKETAEERKQLLALIPLLLKRINTGLDQANISAEERAPFLDACFALQTAALRNRTAPTTPTASQPATAECLMAPLFPQTARTSPAPEVQVLEHNGKLVQYLGVPTETSSPWHSGSSKAWTEGDWVNFQLPDGERLCGRICGSSSACGTVLLFNSDWGFAVALSPALLQHQLRSDQARTASGHRLFDEAAEQVLGQIRHV